jgi:NTP pyrophosphatase (non-canonical NTP hydrolase)
MIVTKAGTIETYVALTSIVDALDRRFPDGNNIFQRVSRLCEESGELASAVNHREKMGIKRDKYGAPDDDHLVKEIQDVMRACLGIAKHYHLENALEESIQDFYTDYEEKGRLSY